MILHKKSNFVLKREKLPQEVSNHLRDIDADLKAIFINFQEIEKRLAALEP